MYIKGNLSGIKFQCRCCFVFKPLTDILLLYLFSRFNKMKSFKKNPITKKILIIYYNMYYYYRYLVGTKIKT